MSHQTPSFEDILGSSSFADTRTQGQGPDGKLPITEAMLLNEPSGNLFALTQNAGMGWNPDDVGHTPYLILSTQGGYRADDGTPIALGYHTGHWEIGLLVKAAAEVMREQGALPFSATVSDPCDGRSQGTTGMFDSLAYR
jgi:xylonate dehydratase